MVQNPYKVSNVEKASHKTIKTLKNFDHFCDNCKIPSFDYHLKEITHVCRFLRVSLKSQKILRVKSAFNLQISFQLKRIL